ncbi:UNVERIFIED_CONTAM: hypothetical protein FKN15_056605 [Acipenser sinensis]
MERGPRASTAQEGGDKHFPSSKEMLDWVADPEWNWEDLQKVVDLLWARDGEHWECWEQHYYPVPFVNPAAVLINYLAADMGLPQQVAFQVGGATSTCTLTGLKGDYLQLPSPPAGEECLLVSPPAPEGQEPSLPSPAPEGGVPPLSPEREGEPHQSPASEGDPHRSPAREGDPHQSPASEGEPHQSPAREGTECLVLDGLAVHSRVSRKPDIQEGDGVTMPKVITLMRYTMCQSWIGGDTAYTNRELSLQASIKPRLHFTTVTIIALHRTCSKSTHCQEK